MITRMDCIRAAVNAGATEEQAAGIVDAILEKKKLPRADGRLAPEAARMTALKRRRAMLTVVRRDEALRDIRRAQAEGLGFLDGLRALLAGGLKNAAGAPHSVSAQWRAVFASWADPLARELDGVGAEEIGKGGALRLLRGDKDFHDAVIVAMREPDAAAEPLAREMADVIARYAEAARQRFNLAGGNMGRLEGWTPQRHDVEKLLKAGPDVWQREILPLLDMERTFGRDAADAGRVREVLSGIYDTLLLGRNPFLGGGSGREVPAPPEHARVLLFKSGRDAVDYNDRFGSGNLVDAFLLHLEFMARAVALMERLGPNPEQSVRWLINKERERVHAELDYETRRKPLLELDEAMTRVAAGRASAKLFAGLTGEAGECVFPTLAKISHASRAARTLDALGRASRSAVSDVFVKAARMRCNGETWPGAITKGVLRYLENYRDGAERRVAAGQAGDFLDALTRALAVSWDTDSDAVGRLARMRNWMLRWTGLDWITEQGRIGYGLWLSRYLGDASTREWDALSPDVRSMLERHGVDALRWDVLRSMTAIDEEGRRRFLPVDASPDAAKLEKLLPERLRGEQAARFAAAREAELARLRERLRTDALSMLAHETRLAISAPDDVARAVTRQLGLRLTYAGEFWRFMMRFRGFPAAYVRRVTGDLLWRRHPPQGEDAADSAGFRSMPGVLGFAMLAVSLGYAAMALKDIARGRKPRDPDDMEAWLAACLQSGGLGVFGDFLFGEASRFRSGAASADEEQDTVASSGASRQAGEEFISEALANAPFVNLWQLRTALNYATLLHVLEWLRPGGLRRMERRMKRREREFLPPSSVAACNAFRCR